MINFQIIEILNRKSNDLEINVDDLIKNSHEKNEFFSRHEYLSLIKNEEDVSFNNSNNSNEVKKTNKVKFIL